MSILFECQIPGRVGIKKNNKRAFRNMNGRMIILSSENYLSWEKIAYQHIKQAMVDYPILPITGHLHAEFEFYFKNHQAEPDLSNCIEGPQDVLQLCGVIENDKQIISIGAKKFFGELP